MDDKWGTPIILCGDLLIYGLVHSNVLLVKEYPTRSRICWYIGLLLSHEQGAHILIDIPCELILVFGRSTWSVIYPMPSDRFLCKCTVSQTDGMG